LFVCADGHHAGSIHTGPRRLDDFNEDEAHIGMKRLVLCHVVDPAENAGTGAARKEIVVRAQSAVTLDKYQSVVLAESDLAAAVGLFHQSRYVPQLPTGRAVPVGRLGLHANALDLYCDRTLRLGDKNQIDVARRPPPVLLDERLDYAGLDIGVGGKSEFFQQQLARRPQPDQPMYDLLLTSIRDLLTRVGACAIKKPDGGIEPGTRRCTIGIERAPTELNRRGHDAIMLRQARDYLRPRSGCARSKMAQCRWLTPMLVGFFEFVEWTPDSHLRHARFMWLREDQEAGEVVRES